METVSQRFDQLDRERFKDMVDSPSFRILFDRIVKELERARATAERHECSIKEVRIAQGTVAALRMVLGLPNQIVNEMKGKTK